MKTYFFDAGLPRSGSTLLSALLNQNPQIYSGPLSPVFELMYNVENYLNFSEQAHAYPKPESYLKIISSILENYYIDVNKPYVIDKCRAWTGQIPFIKKYITNAPKIICTVRNPLDILASFIDLIHKSPTEVSFIDKILKSNNIELTDNNRCDYLMSKSGVVFNSINGIAKTFYEKNDDCLLLIDYNDLTSNPKSCIERVYNFLELPLYNHSYKNITSTFVMNDERVYGLKKMHQLKPNIEKIDRDYETVLSKYVINKYSNLDFWNK